MQIIKPMQKYFTVHGEGTGGKAGDLIKKAGPILDADWALAKRHVLGMSLVFDYIKRCGAEQALKDGRSFEEIRKLIDDGEFGPAEKKLIELICREFAVEKFLAVRSSAHGDARGTGIYDSFYSPNLPDAAEWFVKGVIGSYFTQDAAFFRADAGLQEGIAVMIEPLIAERQRATSFWGEPIDEDVYAPLLSGYGQTNSREGPFAGVARGLAANYVKDPRYGRIFKPRHANVPLAELTFDRNKIAKEGWSFFKKAAYVRENCEFGEGKVKNRTEDYSFNLAPLFGRILRLKEGIPDIQYFEWAMRDEHASSVYYMNQIADVPKLEFVFDAEKAVTDRGRVLGIGANVCGEGHVLASHIVHIYEEDGWKALDGLNEKPMKYTLLFDGAAAGEEVFGSMSYGRFRKAPVMIENGGGEETDANWSGLGNLSAHFGGALAMVHKMMFQTKKKISLPKLVQHAKSVENLPGATVYEIPNEILASEAQQKAIIQINE